MNPLHDPRGYSLHSADRLALGAVLLFNLFSRLGCGICGPNPVPDRKLTAAVQMVDPGYCIDAPEVMPAGGMGNFSLPPCEEGEEPQWLAEQLLCERENSIGP